MSTIPGSRARRGLALAVLGLFVVACSPATSATASPSSPPSAPPSLAPTPIPTPSLAPTPNPTQAASPSAAAAADPSVGLKIGPPYTLQPLDPAIEESLRQQYASSAGAFASLIGVGGRTVIANGIPVAFVFVIGMPTGTMTDAVYQSMVTGMASSTGAQLKSTTIAGTDVSTGSVQTGAIGVYRDGDRMVMAITPQASDLNGVAEALVTAND